MPKKPVPLSHMARRYIQPAGWIGSVVVTLGCMGFSLGLYLAATGTMRLSIDVPVWVLYVLAIAIGYIGVLEMAHGLLDMYSRCRRRVMMRTRPNEPWFADYPWDPRRIYDDNLTRGVRRTYIAVFWGFLLFSVNWFAFASEHGLPLIQLFVGVCDVGFVIVARSFRQSLKFGRSYVRFSKFPMQLGEEVTFVFGMEDTMLPPRCLKFRLRFVEEGGSHADEQHAMTPFELYGQNGVLEKDDLGPCIEVEISVRLPMEPFYLNDVALLAQLYL